MNNKTDLIIMLLMIIENINFSIALMLTPLSALTIVILCVNIFCLLCLLGIYAHQLYNIHKGEKKELNNFMDELVNCPDRVSPPKFKKGDWIITNEDFEYNLGYCLHIEEVVTDGSDNYYNIRTYYKEPLIPLYEETLSQYHAPWIDKNYRLATPEEIQYHKEHYSQPQS